MALKATLVNGILTEFGDSLDNNITTSRDAAGTLLVNGGAVPVDGGTATVANTTLIQAFGQDGNDVITLSETNGALPKANLFGGVGNDVLTGGSGSDQLFGQADNDTLLGKGGNDFLFGGAGDDILTGGDADDQMFGEAGNDRMIWNPGDDSDLMEGGDDIDTAEVNGGNGAEVFTVAANGARVRFDRLDPAPFSLDIGTTEKLVVNMNGGDDSFSATGNLAALIGITVDGGTGNDTILGSNGADTLFGGDDNDFIDGNQGNDTVFLGAGDDVAQWDPGDGNDIIEGQAGNDTLLFNGSAGAEAMELSANGARTLLTRNLGNIVMDLNDVEKIDIHALAGVDAITVNNLAGTDVTEVNIDLAGALGGTSGDASADVVGVAGTSGNDVIDVFGAGSSVSVLGLSARVNITNSEGANDALVISAGAGNDGITATTMPAGVINLTLDGGAGNDTILGSQGADTLIGGDGNDFVFGDNGNDTAFLGAGDDVFEWDPGDGNDTIDGGDGTDQLLFFGANIAENINIVANANHALFTRDVANITMDLDNVEHIEYRALGGADNITIGDLSGTDVTQVNIDLRGPNGGGDGAADTVAVNGSQGVDTVAVTGDANGISVSGLQAAVNIFFPEQANDKLILNGNGGNDVMNASGLKANGIQLTMNGGLGDDLLIGSEGDDIINGGDGSDTALMGAGNDTFVWNPGDDNDIVEGQAGVDTLLFNGANVAEHINISANGNRALFTRDVANVVMDLNDVETVRFNALGGADVITINDLSGADIKEIDIDLGAANGVGDGAADTVVINGTSGNDTISLRMEGDNLVIKGLSQQIFVQQFEAGDTIQINGLGGDDVVDASALGPNGPKIVINGGDGNDVLLGGKGADVIQGGADQDILVGGGGQDVLDGGPGENIVINAGNLDTVDGLLTVFGNGIADTLTISRNAAGAILVNGATPTGIATPTVANTDLIQVFGKDGDDTLTINETNGALPRAEMFGGAGNDTVTGGSGADLIYGESGNDTLLGKGGNDFLFGGAGDDILTGGDGNDQVFGQDGNDRMIWNPGDDTDLFEGGAGTDTAEVNAGNGDEVFQLTANGARVAFDRVTPAPFRLDIGTTEKLVVNMNGGNDQFSAVGNLASLISVTVDGGAGDDTITGGNGADTLLGGTGTDVIDGGQGDDLLEGGAGADTLAGGIGTDTLSYAGSSAAVTVNLATGVGNGGDAAGDTWSGIENVTGSAFNDALTGDANANVLTGGGGNDALDGGGGTDTAAFSGTRSQYFIEKLANGDFKITDLRAGSPDGADTVHSIEKLAFADGILDIAVAANQPPVIVSNGGADTATIQVKENVSAVTIVAALDGDASTPITYSIVGGVDAGRFTIDAKTGALSFIKAPNFEAPTDADHNNSYIVKVSASDGAIHDDQTITVNVTDVLEQQKQFDFNGDGKGDILWQNHDGTPAVWLLDGANVSAMGSALPNPNAGLSGGIVRGDVVGAWYEVASGDFNGDGKADILWQNHDGTPAVWLMNGTSLLSSGPALVNPGPTWHANEAADFNGDGKADILWQNNDGTAAVWLMDGTGVLQAGGPLPNPGPTWHEKAAADFNADGKADILWQNDDGTAAVWLMDGVNVMGMGGALPNPGPSWHAAAAGDFNGDSKADILWQNDNGAAAVWLMDGTQVLEMGAALPNPGSSWHAKEAIDANGDGKADILWQNNDGTPAVWLMDGVHVSQMGSPLANPGTDWHVI